MKSSGLRTAILTAMATLWLFVACSSRASATYELHLLSVTQTGGLWVYDYRLLQYGDVFINPASDSLTISGLDPTGTHVASVLTKDPLFPSHIDATLDWAVGPSTASSVSWTRFKETFADVKNYSRFRITSDSAPGSVSWSAVSPDGTNGGPITGPLAKVPEPTTMALFGIGLGAIAMKRRKQLRRKA